NDKANSADATPTAKGFLAKVIDLLFILFSPPCPCRILKCSFSYITKPTDPISAYLAKIITSFQAASKGCKA
ncbi:hypothetical protein C9994_16510, partial [Marivirga lumbricoides]